jgi:hypothetical protein
MRANDSKIVAEINRNGESAKAKTKKQNKPKPTSLNPAQPKSKFVNLVRQKKPRERRKMRTNVQAVTSSTKRGWGDHCNQHCQRNSEATHVPKTY